MKTRLLLVIVIVISFQLYGLQTVRSASTERPELLVQLGHAQPVYSLEFSRDGRYLASGGGDGSVKLWDMETGRLVRTIQGHILFVFHVSLSPDAARLASGGLTDIIVWDMHNGKQLYKIPGDKLKPLFSPDGKRLAAIGKDSLRIFDAATGKEEKNFPEFKGIDQAAFSPDGNRLVFRTAHGLSYRELASGREIKTLKGIDAIPLFSSDGHQVITEDKDRFHVWDLNSGKVVKEIPRTSGTFVSPDWTFTAEYRPDEGIKIIDTNSSRTVRTIPGSHGTRLFKNKDALSRAISADGRYLATGGFDTNVMVWDITDGTSRVLTGYGSDQRALVLSYDGRFASTATEHSRLVVWELKTGKMVHSIPSEKPWTLSSFSFDNRYLLASSDNMIKLIELSTGEIAGTIQHHQKGAEKVFFVDRQHAFSWGSGLLKLWDVTAKKELRSIPADISASAYHPASATVLLGMKDGSVRVFDLKNWKIAGAFEGNLAYMLQQVKRLEKQPDQKTASWQIREMLKDRSITGLTFSHDGRMAASLMRGSRHVIIWDVKTQKEVNSFDMLGYNYLMFTPDSSELINVGSPTSKVVFFDIKTGKETRSFFAHQGFFSGGGFTPREHFFVTAGQDTTLKIWDRNYRLVAMLAADRTGEWVTVIPEGYFKASQNGAGNLNVRQGMRAFGLEQFYDVFYRPELVELALAGRENVAQYAPLTIEDALNNPPPLVEITPPAASKAQQHVKIAYTVKSTGGGIGDIRIFHNGKLIQSDGFYRDAAPAGRTKLDLKEYKGEAVKQQLRGLAIRGKAEASPISTRPRGDFVTGEISVEPVTGLNEISITAFNRLNSVQAMRKTVRFDSHAPSPPPRLHIVAVGIDEYKQASVNLKFAVRDAESFSEKLRRQAASLYKPENVGVTLLKNGEATKANILAVISALSREIKLPDSLVLFVASHGILNNGVYSIVTHDFDGELDAARLISANEILEISKQLKALRQLIILDTCHAGGLDSFLSGLYDSRMTVLAKNIGLHLFASASSAQEALDGYKGNGLFTYTLLDGLNNNRQADRNMDGKVSVEGLGLYSRRMTVDLSRKIGHAQTPLIINFGQDYPLYTLTAGAK